MKKFMFALLLLAGCTATLQDTSVTEPDDDARSRQTQGQESSLIPGSMIIEVTDELADQLAAGSLQTKSSSVNAAFEALDVVKIERVFPDAGEFEPRHRAAGRPSSQPSPAKRHLGTGCAADKARQNTPAIPAVIILLNISSPSA